LSFDNEPEDPQQPVETPDSNSPEDWLCDDDLWDNGQCDCNCGIYDPDCDARKPYDLLYDGSTNTAVYEQDFINFFNTCLIDGECPTDVDSNDFDLEEITASVADSKIDEAQWCTCDGEIENVSRNELKNCDGDGDGDDTIVVDADATSSANKKAVTSAISIVGAFIFLNMV